MADIKRQKLFLERSVKSMQSDVDDYQTLAEEKNHISYLQHSYFLARKTVFRKTVRESEDSLKDSDQATGKMECELKNMK